MEKYAPGAARWIDPVENSNWDALVSSRPDFSFFHSAAWAKVLAETYGFVPRYFFTGNAAAPDTVLPLMEVNSRLTGRRGISLPFTDECVPLGADPDSLAKLFQAAVEFGRARKWKYLELRGGKNLFAPTVPASLNFYSHWLDLDTEENRMFGALEGSVRRAIRKAEKDGVTVEISQSQTAMEIFYALQGLTRKKHGLPPQPRAFFMNIHRHILSENRGFIAVASYQGRPIAASVYFFMAGRAIYKFGASDAAAQQLRGNNLVMWTAMKRLAQNGMKTLHLGRTSLANDGLRRFKLNFGAHEETAAYVKFDLRQNRFVTDTDGVAGWHNVVFRRLPVSLSRLAGRMLYKHWA